MKTITERQNAGAQRSAAQQSNMQPAQKAALFTDNRASQENMNSMQNVMQQHSADSNPVQFALPHGGLPDTKGYYNPRGAAKKKEYKGGRPTNFSTRFKLKLVKNEWFLYF